MVAELGGGGAGGARPGTAVLDGDAVRSGRRSGCWCRARAGVDAAVEDAPVGDHASNGSIESGVRTVSAQIRALKMQLENRYNIELDNSHPLIPWIVERAGWIVSQSIRGWPSRQKANASLEGKAIQPAGV